MLKRNDLKYVRAWTGLGRVTRWLDGNASPASMPVEYILQNCIDTHCCRFLGSSLPLVVIKEVWDKGLQEKWYNPVVRI